MNNLIFNTTAATLHTAVYGVNEQTGCFQALSLDANGLLRTAPVTVANDIGIINRLYTDTATVSSGAGTGYVFECTDISAFRTVTLFAVNNGTSDLILTLQLSPDGSTWFNDPNHQSISVAPGGKVIIVVDIFAHFLRLQYNTSATPCFTAYINAQT